MNSRCQAVSLGVLLAVGALARADEGSAASPWKVGTPIVTYWAGPPMTDTAARQMADGGWNLVWCGEKDLDLVGRHGLRGQLEDPLLAPATLTDPPRREKLDALIARVRAHPALYAYFLTDEPNATNFAGLGKLVAYLRERDPAHLAYINLFPTYATNEQLGNSGDTVDAYQAHLRQYVDVVKPNLISYDHYQFATNGDSPHYFLNLALVRRAAQDAGLPFLNIVQACSWTPSMRVPKADEMRYLLSTTLAYGGQGISYFVYTYAGFEGGIANTNGTPTALYDALKPLNREFVAVARQLQPLRSLGVYHAGMRPPGTELLPQDSAFTLDPPVSAMEYKVPERVRGVMLGTFGAAGAASGAATPTHAMVVNLDYRAETVVGVRGPGSLEIFDPATDRWTPAGGARAELHLAPGGGRLVRVRR